LSSLYVLALGRALVRTILERTLTSGLLAATAVLAAPGVALAAPAHCRASGPTTLGPQLGISDSAWRVNNHGDVVGTFAESQYDQHTYLWSHGTVQEMGLPGSELTYPTALTDSGYILGTSAGPGGLRSPSFLWHGGTQTDLSDAVEPNFPHDPSVGVEPYVQGSAINDSGLVVGYESDRSITYTVTWQNGELTRIPGMGGTLPTEPAAVNDAGLVAVSARLPDDAFLHAAIWTGQILRDLGTLGGQGSSAADLNAAGHVVGDSLTAAGANHAFLYRHGRMIDLGLPAGGVWASADLVNDRDQVVGKWRGEDGATRVFVWDHGRITDLGADTVAYAVNARGQVLAYQSSEDYTTGTGFVWTDGIRVDLPALSPGRLAGGSAINDRGQVVGWADTAEGVRRSVSWTVTCRR
jgi:probable HAF family extracellular repeat protein